MSDDLGILNDFAADEPNNDLSSRLDPMVSEPMEPGVVDASTPLPGLGVPPPIVIEPVEPDYASPLLGVDPGDSGELPPGTIFPGVTPTTSGGGGGGKVVSAQTPADFSTPPRPRPKSNCPHGDFVRFTAGSSPLTVTVYNGFVGGVAKKVMQQKTVNQGDAPVTYTGCFTHWKATVAVGGYTVVGQLDGIPFSFQ